MGLLSAAQFLFISQAKPLAALSPVRPHRSIFNAYFFGSLLGQFGLHLGLLVGGREGRAGCLQGACEGNGKEGKRSVVLGRAWVRRRLGVLMGKRGCLEGLDDRTGNTACVAARAQAQRPLLPLEPKRSGRCFAAAGAAAAAAAAATPAASEPSPPRLPLPPPPSPPQFHFYRQALASMPHEERLSSDAEFRPNLVNTVCCIVQGSVQVRLS
jgi:hypothetical protein